jgi:hypothetical protein
MWPKLSKLQVDIQKCMALPFILAVQYVPFNLLFKMSFCLFEAFCLLFVALQESLGITDINCPDFGDAVDIHEGEIPVFWACGVTPQAIVMSSKYVYTILFACFEEIGLTIVLLK